MSHGTTDFDKQKFYNLQFAMDAIYAEIFLFFRKELLTLHVQDSSDKFIMKGSEFISISYTIFLTKIPSEKTRVSQFCQKLKIQKVIPLKCLIGSNSFQKVQKLENGLFCV